MPPKSLPHRGRWLRVQRADGGVAAWLLLFTSTPQSIRLAAYCQLPGRGAFLGALYKLLHSLGGPPMTAPTLHIINLWQKHGDAQRPPQLYNLLRSPAVRRISHGAGIHHTSNRGYTANAKCELISDLLTRHIATNYA